MTSNVGFTGTQDGMTDVQKYQVRAVLHTLAILNSDVTLTFHHGDCIGADATAHGLARLVGYDIVIHPPINPKKRAYCNQMGATLCSHGERDYLDRNRDIVDASDFVIAAPKEMDEVIRSGTWSTARYAIRRGIHTLIVYPDGQIERRRAL